MIHEWKIFLRSQSTSRYSKSTFYAELRQTLATWAHVIRLDHRKTFLVTSFSAFDSSRNHYQGIHHSTTPGLIQIQDQQNKANPCLMRDTACSPGATHVPSQPLIIPNPRDVPSRDYGIPWVLQETFFERLPDREGPPWALFENSKNWHRSLEEEFESGLGPDNTGNIMEHRRGVRREPQSSAIPTPRFNQGVATLNSMSHTGGT